MMTFVWIQKLKCVGTLKNKYNVMVMIYWETVQNVMTIIGWQITVWWYWYSVCAFWWKREWYSVMALVQESVMALSSLVHYDQKENKSTVWWHWYKKCDGTYLHLKKSTVWMALIHCVNKKSTVWGHWYKKVWWHLSDLKWSTVWWH